MTTSSVLPAEVAIECMRGPEVACVATNAPSATPGHIRKPGKEKNGQGEAARRPYDAAEGSVDEGRLEGQLRKQKICDSDC